VGRKAPVAVFIIVRRGLGGGGGGLGEFLRGLKCRPPMDVSDILFPARLAIGQNGEIVPLLRWKEGEGHLGKKPTGGGGDRGNFRLCHFSTSD